MTTNVANVFVQYRTSPISRAAASFTFTLAAIALITAIWTRLTFIALPNMMPFTLAVLVLDFLSQFAPQTRVVGAVQTILHGVLFLAITCFCGVVAAYATQRFAFPLQDRLLEGADRALGVNWFDVAHWVDDRPVVHTVFKLAYKTMGTQIALPIVVLAFSDRLNEIRRYLLAFALALTITTVVAAFLPAASPIALVDQTTFHVLRFTGATPIDHLMQLRSGEPMFLADGLGGILSFPSFHATVAILTPLTLRGYRRLFLVLLVLDAAMLCGAVTEGAHYVSDVIAGGGVAFFAYFLAKRIIGAGDHSLDCRTRPDTETEKTRIAHHAIQQA